MTFLASGLTKESAPDPDNIRIIVEVYDLSIFDIEPYSTKPGSEKRSLKRTRSVWVPYNGSPKPDLPLPNDIRLRDIEIATLKIETCRLKHLLAIEREENQLLRKINTLN